MTDYEQLQKSDVRVSCAESERAVVEPRHALDELKLRQSPDLAQVMRLRLKVAVEAAGRRWRW
jgi:hypothetical protein